MRKFYSLVFKSRLLTLMLVVCFAFFSFNVSAQCDTCVNTLTSDVVNSSYTFQSGVTCVQGDVDMDANSGVIFAAGSVLCIDENSSLTIRGNITANNTTDWYVEGDLFLNGGNPTIAGDLDLEIGAAGSVQVSSSLSLNGSSNTINIDNGGLLDVNQSLNFGSGSMYVIDNEGNIDIADQLNASSAGVSQIRNQNTLSVINNFQISSNTLVTNCGVINASNGLNLSSGEIINTGTVNLTGGVLDIGSSGEFFNYSIVNSTSNQKVTLSTGKIYNEGYFLTNAGIQGGGSGSLIDGPVSSEDKTGYFYIGTSSDNTIESDTISGRLDFSNSNGSAGQTQNGNVRIFQNVNTLGSNVTFEECTLGGTCFAQDTDEACVNLDGSVNVPPIATDDTYTTDDGVAVEITPLDNDNDGDGGSDGAADLSITSINGTPLTGAAQTIPVSNGTVNVDALGVITFTPDTGHTGSVSFPYEMTDNAASDSIATASITITVNTVPCVISDPGTLTGTCITDSNSLSFTLNLTGQGASANYIVEGATPNVGAYGVSQDFIIDDGADGTSQTITITDASDGACTITVSVLGCDKCTFAGNTDTDSDGVADVCDLDSDNDGILDTVECNTLTTQCGSFANASIEDFDLNAFDSSSFDSVPGIGIVIVDDTFVGSWMSNAPDKKIEIWSNSQTNKTVAGTSTFIQAKEGDKWFELNANQLGGVYQDVCSTGGEIITWSFWHRWRNDSSEEMRLSIGPEGGVANFTQDFTATNSWVQYSGTYTVPSGQSSTRFAFTALTTGGQGNFVDDMVITFPVTGATICDTDNDGIPDYLEIDSDGDGCPDAVEGAGAFSQDNLNSEGRLTSLSSEVDSDGVPTVGSQGTTTEVTTGTVISIDTPPTNQNVNEGDTAIFTSASSALEILSYNTDGTSATTSNTDAGLSYEWFVSTDGGATFGTTPVATTQNLSIISSDANYVNNYMFKLVVSHSSNMCSEEEVVTLNVSSPTPVVDCLDTITYNDDDGDGIIDSCDFDSDNDGILDAAELLCEQDSDLNWTLTSPVVGSFTENNLNGSTVDVDIDIDNSPDTLLSSDNLTTSNVNGLNGGEILHRVNFSDGASGATENPVVEFTFNEDVLLNSVAIQDIDRGNGWQDAVRFEAFDVNNKMVPLNLVLGAELAYNTDGFIVHPNVDDQAADTDQDYWVTASSNLPIRRLIIITDAGDGGSGVGSSSDNRIFISNLDLCTVVDTDNDGVPDYLDTDSDNDGCPDAVEGAGAFSQDNLNSEGRLTSLSSEVDSDGVPIVGSQIGTNAVLTGVVISIDTLPQDVAVTIGDTAIFTSTSSALESLTYNTNGDVLTTSNADSGLSYAWFVSSDGGVNFGTTEIGTSTDLSIASSDTNYVNGYVFKLVISHNDNSCIEEVDVILSINPTVADVSDATVTEGDDLVQTVTLSEETSQPVTYPFDLSDDTAVDGVDYTNAPTFSNGVVLNSDGTITVPAGVTTFTVTYATLEDTLDEGSETTILTVGGEEGTGTIEDPADPTVADVSDATVTEGDDLVQTVTLSEETSQPVTYPFDLSDDTAVDGDDYTNAPTFSNGVVLNSDGTITVPAGVTTFTVTYATLEDTLDDDGETTTLTVGGEEGTGTIADPANGAPVADDESEEIPADAPVVIDVLDGDTDPDNDPLTVTEINGTPVVSGDTVTLLDGTEVTLNTDGTITVDPVDGSTDPISFPYTVSDGDLTDEGQVDLTIEDPANEAPVADDESEEIPADVPVVIDVLDGDTDPENDPLTVTEIDGTPVVPGDTVTLTDGTEVTLNPDGTLTVDPVDGSEAPISFPYTVSDGELTDEGQVDLTIEDPANEAPVADDESEEIPADVPVVIDVLDGDTDPENDPLTVTEIDGTPVVPGDTVTLTDGTEVTLNPDGTITVDPVDGSEAPISFPYTVSDGELTDEGQVDLTIEDPANEAPVVVNDMEEIPADSPSVVDILGNDSDPEGEALTITEIDGTPVVPGDSVTLPDGTEVTLNNDGTVTVDPVDESTDPISFAYTVTDGETAVEGLVDLEVVIDGIIVINEFSPNNGDDIGDYLHITGINNYENNSVEIFNRWGNTVFKMKGYDNDDASKRFEGISNGRVTIAELKELPVGTYFYVIDLGNGDPISKGWIYINR